MNNPVDKKRLVLFLVFAFGLAWLAALIIYRTGGLANSPELIPGSGLTLSFVLTTLGYMWAPAVANLLTRLITREGWSNAMLRPNFRRGWRYWLAAWLLPPLFVIAGAVVYFAVFPQHFDAELTTLQRQIAAVGQTMNPWVIVLVQTLSAILIAPVINALFTFGEEFGWRGYLLPKLLPLGERKAIVLSGIIWGIWHYPMIAMGHNYGTQYPGYPWMGFLAMTWFTIVTGALLGWATIKGGSVWPAVIGHAIINGIAALPVLLMTGDINPTIGPLSVGFLGSIAWTAFALYLFLRPAALEIRSTAADAPAVVE